MNRYQAQCAVFLLFFCIINLTNSVRFVPKWKKQACEVPASQNDESHYTCTDNGEVKCLPGEFQPICNFILYNLFILLKYRRF